MEGIKRLLDRVRQGTSEAFSVLYRRFLPAIFGSIATRVPDRATAEDLTSEVFVEMVEGIHRQSRAVPSQLSSTTRRRKENEAA